MSHLARCVKLQQLWIEVKTECANQMLNLMHSTFPEEECSRTVINNLFFPIHVCDQDTYKERSLRLKGFISLEITEKIKLVFTLCDNQIKFLCTKFLICFSTQVYNHIWTFQNTAILT
jgi:hypothetical protein